MKRLHMQNNTHMVEFSDNNTGKMQIKAFRKSHPEFKGKLIDATEGLSKNAASNFFTSDSHWNQRGAKIWLEQLNTQLKN